MNPEERPSKRDAFLAFFGEGWVSIHLDARREGVEVPTEFADNRHLVLQYGQNMPIPIPDLAVNDKGVSATLSFSRTPYRTFVPWSAVYIVACTDGRGILYYEDVPEDVSLVARPVDGKTGEPLEAAVLDAGDLDDDGSLADDEPRRGHASDLAADIASDVAAADIGEGSGAGDLASDIAGDIDRTPGPEGKGGPKARARAKKRERLLKSVPAEPSNDDPPSTDDEATTAAKRRKRPQLRVVK